MLLDRPGERTYPHDAVVDLDDLRNRPYGALSDDEPCALTHEFGSECFVEECPRQTRLVLAVEVDDQVELGSSALAFTRAPSEVRIPANTSMFARQERVTSESNSIRAKVHVRRPKGWDDFDLDAFEVVTPVHDDGGEPLEPCLAGAVDLDIVSGQQR